MNLLAVFGAKVWCKKEPFTGACRLRSSEGFSTGARLPIVADVAGHDGEAVMKRGRGDDQIGL